MLRQEKLEIDQQLRAIQGNPTMNTMQNFTVQRRSDRGYSSDVDTMRPSRGSGASTSHQPSTSNAPRGRGGRGRFKNVRGSMNDQRSTVTDQRSKLLFSVFVFLNFDFHFVNHIDYK